MTQLKVGSPGSKGTDFLGGEEKEQDIHPS